MKAIKFTDQELESMIEMYQVELEYAQKDVANIQEILKKLGAKPAVDVVVEKEPKKRGRKPSVKAVEIKERKKPGRKPKAATVPEVKTVAETAIKPAKKEKAVKIKVERKPVVNPKPIKKASKVAESSAKSGPVAATQANAKAPKPIKEKVSKVKATKPVKEEIKKEVAKTVESVVSSLLTTAPKKEVAKIVKKKAPKKRTKGFVRLAPLGKPLTKKVVDEPGPIEPTAPAEQS